MTVRIDANLKEKTINLRKRGLTYSEILKKIPVAKSTLSLWLRSVDLSKQQKQRITDKKLDSAKRGGERKRQIRIELVKNIQKQAQDDVKQLNNQDLWLTGVMLYWAEGSKEKEHTIGQQTIFSNSDPKMIQLFLKWLKKIIKIPQKDIGFEIYIHEIGDVERAKNWWSKIVSCDKNKFKVYFKKHRIKRTYRKNRGENYYGLLRIRVKRSCYLNRKISAWVNAICNYWGVVQW